MEFKISTKQMLQILKVVAWVIFIGVCIEAGSFIFNAIFTLASNNENAAYFNLTDLYRFDRGQFLVVMLFMSITAVLRAIMFYRIVKILGENKLDIVQPFNHEMGRFLFMVSYLALGIGLFSWWGVNYVIWLEEQGVKMPDAQQMQLTGADVWLFMGVTLLVIAQIFKRGIEMQSEQELTI